MGNLGYACINMTLNERGVKTGRALRKSTLESNGISMASQIALDNVKDLKTILQWNIEHDIHFFRLGSDVFPWGDKIGIHRLPHYNEILNILEECGDIIQKGNIRVTSHPGQFNILSSNKESVIENTISDLEQHALVFDLLGLSRTPYNKINIHIGATFGDKNSASDTWCINFEHLSDSVKSRLTIENDDKSNCYSVQDLYNLIHKRVGIPIVFDYHHHKFCNGGLTEKEALELSISTWNDVKPVVHYSESVTPDKLNRGHSDYIENYIDTYGYDVDIMIEAKAKELALLKYREKYQ